MNFVKEYKDGFKDKYSGFFIIDVDKWHKNIWESSKVGGEYEKLTDEKKTALAIFLLKDVMCGICVLDNDEMIYSLTEHHYDSNFSEPFIVREDSNMVPMQASETTYYVNSIKYVRESFSDGCGGSNGAVMNSARTDVLPTAEGEKPLNKIVDEIPEWIGKVVIKRSIKTQSHHVLEKIVNRITNEHADREPYINYYYY